MSYTKIKDKLIFWQICLVGKKAGLDTGFYKFLNITFSFCFIGEDSFEYLA